jgi:hypothetical protein
VTFGYEDSSMTLKKFFLSSLLGGLVLGGGLMAVLGPSQTGTLLFFSIICTLGIGLAFWLGIAFALGLLILTLWDAARGHHAPSLPHANGQSEALTTYISRSLQAGANHDQLSRRLLRQGWTADDIDQAFQQVQGQLPPDLSGPGAPGPA